jgi:DNA replication protein DnaC
MELTHQVSAQLKRLRLSGVVETLEARQRQAIDGKWSYVDFLARLLEDELERRAQKQLALRSRAGSICARNTMC